MPSVLTILHLVAFAHFVYGVFYDLNYLVFPDSFNMNDPIVPMKGRLKFLTFWDMLLQTFYFGVALLNDFIGSNENVPSKMPLIRRFKDFLFCSLAFPLAMFVGVSFWGLMAVDRELVFPKVLDEFFPSWLNHVMHTNIMIFIVLEMFLSYRQYPPRKYGVTCLSILLITYMIWVQVIYFYSGYWVYPVLTVLSWPLKIVFYVVLASLIISLYYVGEYANNKVWGKQSSQSRRTGKKKSN